MTDHLCTYINRSFLFICSNINSIKAKNIGIYTEFRFVIRFHSFFLGVGAAVVLVLTFFALSTGANSGL